MRLRRQVPSPPSSSVCVFHVAVVSDYTESTARRYMEWVLVKLRFYPHISPGKLRKTTEGLRCDSQCLGRDSNRVPLEYKSTSSPLYHNGVQSKVQICGRSTAGITGSNPAEDMDVRLLCLLCCEVAASACSRSLIQRSSTECDA